MKNKKPRIIGTLFGILSGTLFGILSGILFGILSTSVLALAAGETSRAETSIRAVELTPQVWAAFEKGASRVITIEFRQGDRLPVSLRAEGDLIETTESAPNYVVVKRPFWVKFGSGQVQMSLDGRRFRRFDRLIRGNFTAGASSGNPGGGIATAISLMFAAEIK